MEGICNSIVYVLVLDSYQFYRYGDSYCLSSWFDMPLFIIVSMVLLSFLLGHKTVKWTIRLQAGTSKNAATSLLHGCFLIDFLIEWPSSVDTLGIQLFVEGESMSSCFE